MPTSIFFSLLSCTHKAWEDTSLEEATITDKTVETTESNINLCDIHTLIAYMYFSSPFPIFNVALYMNGLSQNIFSKKQTTTLRREGQRWHFWAGVWVFALQLRRAAFQLICLCLNRFCPWLQGEASINMYCNHMKAWAIESLHYSWY